MTILRRELDNQKESKSTERFRYDGKTSDGNAHQTDMTNVPTTVDSLLVKWLPAELDAVFRGAGFRRSENSLEYIRSLRGSTQYFRLVYNVRPENKGRASAHLLPQIKYVVPELNRQVLEMMGSYPSLCDEHGVTFSIQIQNAAPRDVRQQAASWFVVDEPSTRESLKAVRDFVQRWTLPFMDKYSDVSTLAIGYEQRDQCLPQDRRFALFMVAAFTVLGKPQAAMTVLETKFGGAAAKRQYARAIEFVANMLEG